MDRVLTVSAFEQLRAGAVHNPVLPNILQEGGRGISLHVVHEETGREGTPGHQMRSTTQTVCKNGPIHCLVQNTLTFQEPPSKETS